MDLQHKELLLDLENQNVWEVCKDIPFDAHWTCGNLWSELELRLPYDMYDIAEPLAVGPAFYWNGKYGRESRSRYAAPMSSLIYRSLSYESAKSNLLNLLNYIMRSRIIQQIRIPYAPAEVQAEFTKNLGPYYTVEAQRLFDIIYRPDDRVTSLVSEFGVNETSAMGPLGLPTMNNFVYGSFSESPIEKAFRDFLNHHENEPKLVVILGGPYSGRGRVISDAKDFVSDYTGSTSKTYTILDTATIAGREATKVARYQAMKAAIAQWDQMMSERYQLVDTSPESFPLPYTVPRYTRIASQDVSDTSAMEDTLIVSAPAVNQQERSDIGLDTVLGKYPMFIFWAETRSPQARLQRCLEYTPNKFTDIVAAIAREIHPYVSYQIRQHAMVAHVC